MDAFYGHSKSRDKSQIKFHVETDYSWDVTLVYIPFAAFIEHLIVSLLENIG